MDKVNSNDPKMVHPMLRSKGTISVF